MMPGGKRHVVRKCPSQKTLRFEANDPDGPIIEYILVPGHAQRTETSLYTKQVSVLNF